MPYMNKPEEISPDDVCEICGTTRENHGDKHHKFSEDGQLLPLEKGSKPRQEIPKAKEELSREAEIIANDPVANLTLRFIERMIQRNQLDGEDLMYIFGGKQK